MISSCDLCPNLCYADREAGLPGICGAPDTPKAARAALHLWEEPVISGTRGSGAVFFSGCTMRCVFCQNYDISEGGFGKEISVERLSDVFLSLQDLGAHNINLVSATPYVPFVIAALDRCRHRLEIPVVYNSGGFERKETIASLEGYIDVYLPDLKYITPEYTGRYSGRADYFRHAAPAIAEMVRQTGNYKIEDGLLRRGVMVRHLVLPSLKEESLKVIRYLADTYRKDEILISLMRQYTPCHRAKEYPEIHRRLTTYEYQCVVKELEESGFEGFLQGKDSARQEYTPSFDLTGI